MSQKKLRFSKKNRDEIKKAWGCSPRVAEITFNALYNLPKKFDQPQLAMIAIALGKLTEKMHRENTGPDEFIKKVEKDLFS